MSEQAGVGPSHAHAWERRADAALGIAASAILFCMMTLTFVDVVLRYVFNRPLRGGFEVTELMLLVLIFAGLPRLWYWIPVLAGMIGACLAAVVMLIRVNGGK